MPYSFIIDGRSIQANVWDICGLAEHRRKNSTYYRDSKGALLIIDVSKKYEEQDLVDEINYWINAYQEQAGDEAQIILVANKMDLSTDENIRNNSEILNRFSRFKGNPVWIPANAKNPKEVEAIMQTLLQLIYANCSTLVSSQTSIMSHYEDEKLFDPSFYAISKLEIQTEKHYLNCQAKNKQSKLQKFVSQFFSICTSH